MKNNHIVLMLAVLLVWGCGTRQQESGSEDNNGFESEGDIVRVSDQSPIASRLKLLTLSSETLTLKQKFTASVSPRPDAYAQIGLPFSGRITRSAVSLGQKVSRGQTLFEVSSSDFMDAVKEYLQNKNAAALADAELRRKEALHEAGVVSDRELEEARSAQNDASNALEMSSQVLSIFNVEASSVKVGEPLKVVSPISGTVVRNDIVIGQYLAEDSDAPVAVADLGSVRVTANVRPEAVLGLTKGQEAVVGEGIAGKIAYIGEMLDEKTRTVPVVIDCPNPDRTLRPGMFTSVTFNPGSSEIIAVPSSAVFQGVGSKFVYLLVSPGVYRKTPVEVSSLEGGRQAVLEGLEAGQTIIAEGGIYLSE